MAVVFVPLYLLYEAGIFVARVFAKNPIERSAGA
jgi:Sec-independent protein secretion pathway component TatC